MRKFVLGALALVLSVGLAVAADVEFVKFDSATKALTVKEEGKEVTYTITDATKVKRGDKELPAEKVLKYLSEKAEAGTKFELTADKDKKVTEIVMKKK